MIILKHTIEGTTHKMSKDDVCKMINQDRNLEWIDYTDDWRDRLDLTDYELVRVEKCQCQCGNEHENEN